MLLYSHVRLHERLHPAQRVMHCIHVLVKCLITLIWPDTYKAILLLKRSIFVTANLETFKALVLRPLVLFSMPTEL
jgi:hypothetical protein